MKQKYLLLSMILFVFLISATSLSVFAVTPNLELTPATQSVPIGTEGTVNVVVENITNLMAASITLNFDAAKLEYVSSAPGSFFTNAFIVGATPGSGSVTIEMMTLAEKPSGTGTILTVVFERIDGGTTTITFGATELTNDSGNSITHTKGSGCSFGDLLGDFDGDCQVSFPDLIIFALAYNTTPGDPKWNPICDLNSDGAIGFPDLIIFAMHYGDVCGGCTRPSAPTLSDPGTTLPSPANYTVTWSGVTEATSYVLQEATSSDFSSGLQQYPITITSKDFSHTETWTE